MKLTFITVSSPAVRCLIDAGKRINESLPDSLELCVYYAITEMSADKTERLVKDIESADMTFADMMGSPPGVVKAVYDALERAGGDVIPYGNSARDYMRLGDFTAEFIRERSKDGKDGGMMGGMMKKMSKSAMGRGLSEKMMPPYVRDMRNYGEICRYFKVSDLENIYNLLLLLLREYGGYKRMLPEPLPPREVPGISFRAPDASEFFDSFAEYTEKYVFEQNKPLIVILCYAHVYPTDTSICVADIAKRMARLGNVIQIAISGVTPENQQRLRHMLANELPKPPEVILNFMSFRLSAGPVGGEGAKGVDLLTEIDAAYLHPFFMTHRTEREWRESIQGCTASEVMISVMMSELDGSTLSLPVGASSEPKLDTEFDIITEQLEMIEERAENLEKRVEKLLSLRLKPNRDKRVAIICYNYPPGEDNLFGGAFLDTFESVSAITHRLGEEGYNVSPMSASDLMSVFCAGKAVNSGKYGDIWDDMIRMPVKRYKSDSGAVSSWGPPPGEIMTDERDFLIPGIQAGNVFIGLQPSRGTADSAQNYHDKTLAPHHQYIAFYQWLADEWQADAVIHVGTHGTLEFLGGKECGMSGDCYPDKLLYGLPHIYLYYCGNPSEATIAKRRSHAALVGYQPPVFVPGGLYGDYLALSTELDNYRQAQAISPASADAVRLVIAGLAAQLNLPDDIDTIENELHRMAESLIPKGLHVFGSGYTEQERQEYARGLSRYSRNDKESGELAENAAENHEMDGLLRSLAGKYNPPKLAGDIYRSPEVLPTGYNLYQFDPRLIPSQTAMERGREICENTLQRCRAESGAYPKSTAVILWGIETSRTQGETLGQIMAYLGVRLDRDTSPWEKSFQIIPREELGRPRVDVTVNICGFFRDMFPNLIDMLDDVFTAVAEYDEPDNYFRIHSQRLYEKLAAEGCPEETARKLSVSRIFGPKEGQYGTGLTRIIGDKVWESEEELGRGFMASLRHVYNRDMRGKSADGLYEENLKCVDIVSQIRSSHEYEITDLDHYYEFFGGLAKSVELAKGEKARMLITDTTGGRIETDSAEGAIARGIRTRVLNPKWIDGMLAHNYHGAQKIADRFENVMGLAATTGAVEQWIFNDLDAKYVGDDELRRRMSENNPYAYMKILEQMMEYSARGYWDASEDQLERIKRTYLELENDIEATV